ncbi:MAG: YceI family protein [Pseudomonadales bacterium]|nr:YceI family protein [Pseudomonadales bacterium]
MRHFLTNSVRFIRRASWLALAGGLVLTSTAQAGWELDNEASSISFTSVKNARIAEAHLFRDVSGTVTDAGMASIAIDLASVETNIPIRNERMQKMLFDVANFPRATVIAELPMKTVMGISPGTSLPLDLQATLNLHGKQLDISVPVMVLRLENNTWQVSSVKPVVIDAGAFDLGDGVEALREIAGLDQRGHLNENLRF